MDQSPCSTVGKKVNKGVLTAAVRMMMKSCKNALLKAETEARAVSGISSPVICLIKMVVSHFYVYVTPLLTKIPINFPNVP